MQKLKKTLHLLCFSILILSCNSNTEPMNYEGIEDTENRAIAIYNQAYQENHQKDQIVDIIATANNAYILIDPFNEGVPESIAALKANGNEIGAYISIGTGETFRNDYEQLRPYLVSTAWDAWPNEFFINQTTTGVLDIMKARIDKIAAWGCDWVEFDNMDWAYDTVNRNAYNIEATEVEATTYFQALCEYVHQKGMKCMAKNITKGASNFDGVLYESHKNQKNWWNEAGAQAFLDAGKLVIVNHYNETNCGEAYTEYKGIYNANLSFICEDANLKKYVHFNE